MEFLDEMGITGMPAITVLCFLAAELMKRLPFDRKWIPVICAGLGCVLGLGAMFVIPDYPNDNLYSALSVGVVSGFAATGAHQAYQRILAASEKKELTKEETDNGK